jgi:hypothetical protein
VAIKAILADFSPMQKTREKGLKLKNTPFYHAKLA